MSPWPVFSLRVVELCQQKRKEKHYQMPPKTRNKTALPVQYIIFIKNKSRKKAGRGVMLLGPF